MAVDTETVSTDAESCHPTTIGTPCLTRPPPHFSSLLRYVGAGTRLASAPVKSAIAMETKYITMETQDSL